MFGNAAIANSIAKVFYDEDAICREDLAYGKIIDERDYVSNLTLGIRRNTATKGFISYSQALEGSYEKKIGCDAVFVFKSTGPEGVQYKVGLFEAKWPRVAIKSNYKWDYPQKSQDKVSHFSSQITRQASFSDQAVIWEMFFLEIPRGRPHHYFDTEGSSCIRHKPAFEHSNKNNSRVWNNADLDTVMYDHCENIQHIIQDMIMCHSGPPLGGDNNGLVNVEAQTGFIGFEYLTLDRLLDRLDSKEPSKSLQIPVPLDNPNEDTFRERVDRFFKEYGLMNYFFLDLERLDDPQKLTEQLKDAIRSKLKIEANLTHEIKGFSKQGFTDEQKL